MPRRPVVAVGSIEGTGCTECIFCSHGAGQIAINAGAFRAQSVEHGNMRLKSSCAQSHSSSTHHSLSNDFVHKAHSRVAQARQPPHLQATHATHTHTFTCYSHQPADLDRPPPPSCSPRINPDTATPPGFSCPPGETPNPRALLSPGCGPAGTAWGTRVQ
jgi:hypothetical protein